MLTINVVDRDGKEKSIQVKENPSGNLMEVLTEENFDLPAICGGIASCGTCHIIVRAGAEKLESPDEGELFIIEGLSNREEHSRLSCQVHLTKELHEASIQVLGDG